MKKIVVLTGAGISAESGVSTFRDANGLWENHHIEDVASPEGWRRDPDLVRNFYNLRRQQLKSVVPNQGHLSLCELESQYQVVIVTQNVDDLHERAGSKNVVHLHGELRKVRSAVDETEVYSWEDDLSAADVCKHGKPLRPHIVWFGEQVPMLERAVVEVQSADIIIIIGTSLQVYPAASLFEFAKEGAKVYYIDPNPAEVPANVTVLKGSASVEVPKLVVSVF